MIEPDLACRGQKPPCAGCESVRIHAQRMEMSRLISGTPLASGLLPHFCSHALAVKWCGSRKEPQNPKQWPPHLIALSAAGVSAAQVNATVRSASAARAASRVAITTGTTATRHETFTLASSLAPATSVTFATATRPASREPSSTALASPNLRESRISTLTAPWGRRATSIVGRA
eukprot:1718154-Pleurochrysis_carterae.AAC.2